MCGLADTLMVLSQINLCLHPPPPSGGILRVRWEVRPALRLGHTGVGGRAGEEARRPRRRACGDVVGVFERCGGWRSHGVPEARGGHSAAAGDGAVLVRGEQMAKRGN